MRERCSCIVGTIGDWWNAIGWGLFLGSLLVPYLLSASGVVWPILLMILLLLAWWIIDIADQDIPWWMIPVGLLMIAIGSFCRAGILIIACWVIYQLRVRE